MFFETMFFPSRAFRSTLLLSSTVTKPVTKLPLFHHRSPLFHWGFRRVHEQNLRPLLFHAERQVSVKARPLERVFVYVARSTCVSTSTVSTWLAAQLDWCPTCTPQRGCRLTLTLNHESSPQDVGAVTLVF